MMQNIPQVKLGIIAVSRDCFPIQLSERPMARGCMNAPSRWKMSRTCSGPLPMCRLRAATP